MEFYQLGDNIIRDYKEKEGFIMEKKMLLPKVGKLAASVFVFFTRESSYCFQRVIAIAILSVCLSVRLSVRLSVTRVDQSKTVQDRITKSLPSAA